MISLRRLSATSLFGLVTLASIAFLTCLLLIAPPDGVERGQLMQFFGRLHPLAVHLPIALVVLVPLLELAARTQRFSYLSSASSFVLGVATVGSIVAAGLGWLLARSGAYAGTLMMQHMWVATIAAGLIWGCWALKVQTDPSRTARIYSSMLLASVAVMSVAGYRGGQVSHGENHLTEFMPEPVAELLGVSTGVEAPANSRNGGPETFYGARIQPIFVKRCGACHGRGKHKANLRLDSFEGAMYGGKHGAVIKAGDPKSSELFRRITLSPSDNDFMPSQMRALSPAEVKLIEQWIAAGASGTQPRDAVPNVGATAVAEVTFPDADPAVVAKQRAAIALAVVQFQRQLPNVLDYQSRDSSDLVLNAAWKQSKFGDAELATVASLADHIVSADLSSTSITDKSAASIAAMKHLRVLRLTHTRITDEILHSLGSLQELETLSLFDTHVTPKALTEVARMPKLQHVYVGGTKVSVGDRVPKEVARKLVF